MTEAELQELKQKAETGNAEAECELGLYYLDYADEKTEAFKNTIVSGNRGFRFRRGELFPRAPFSEVAEEERKAAFDFFRKAAAHGSVKAIYYLSECYARGAGTAPYPERAQELLLEAAEKGYAPAQYDVGMQAFFGKEKGREAPVEVKPDYPSCIKWLKKSAEQNHSLAQYYLGLCYEEGLGTKQDFEKAVAFYEKSAESELLWALCALGRCYEKGKGVKADVEKAIGYYVRAAEQGDAEAAEALDRLDV